jgi:hypothetical protein
MAQPTGAISVWPAVTADESSSLSSRMRAAT